MIVALLNQKGGVGKTTLALHLASEFAGRGRRVTLIDADSQGSALDWSQQRNREGLPRAFGQRIVFADAAQSGRLASEIDSRSPAAREIAALASEIGQLDIGRDGS